jgi:[ribosomal protein S5]-alanine N-acetyltransferase
MMHQLDFWRECCARGIAICQIPKPCKEEELCWLVQKSITFHDRTIWGGAPTYADEAQLFMDVEYYFLTGIVPKGRTKFFGLTTKRLLLRRITKFDAEFICELVNDPDWLRNIGDKNVHSVADAEHYLKEGPITLYEKYGVGLWAVILCSTGKPIGMCGLVKRDALEDFDLGFAFLPVYRGQGFALEAAQGVLKYVKSEMKLERLAAIVNRDNEPSARLLKKLGFELTGEMQLAGDTKSVDLYYVTYCASSTGTASGTH